MAELSGLEIPYLFPSRYCQSDRLSRLAWDLFGDIENPHEKVVAITDWIHENVEYLRGSTDSITSAYDTVTQRTGVCRDFAHLGIALCRALNIPARYFSGYAYQLEPPDFHACFECFIGGSWVVFDATRLAHLNGLVRIGTGRDAADAAVASIFGSASCTEMTVDCALGAGQKFVPVGREQLRKARRRARALRLIRGFAVDAPAYRAHDDLPLRAAGPFRATSAGAASARRARSAESSGCSCGSSPRTS